MFIGIIAFILILGLLVFVHELGHFFTARKFGVAVEEFGFGLPPRMFGVKKRGTIYSLNWIPVGGFVKIKGQDGDFSDEPDSFIAKPIWQRAIILSAGVLMNVVLAALLLSIGFAVGTPQIIDELDLVGATVKDKNILVAEVLEGSSAASVGVTRGDALVAIDNNAIYSIGQIQDYFNQHPREQINLTIKREGVLEMQAIESFYEPELKRNVIGVELVTIGIVSYPWYQSAILGVKTTGLLIKEIIFAFGNIFYDIFSGQKIDVDLSGPVGIAIITAEISRLGIIYLIQFAAILSINLTIFSATS